MAVQHGQLDPVQNARARATPTAVGHGCEVAGWRVAFETHVILSCTCKQGGWLKLSKVAAGSLATTGFISAIYLAVCEKEGRYGVSKNVTSRER